MKPCLINTFEAHRRIENYLATQFGWQKNEDYFFTNKVKTFPNKESFETKEIDVRVSFSQALAISDCLNEEGLVKREINETLDSEFLFLYSFRPIPNLIIA